MKKGIEISVDDFGISASANARILRLVSDGRIQRVAIMVCGEISSNEIATLCASGVALDIHLDISDSIRPKRKLSDGVMGRGINFFYRYLFGGLSKEKILKLWEKQIVKFRELFGRLPDGLNSHEHVHFFPPFFSVIVALADRYGIPYVRLGSKASRKLHKVSIILDAFRFFDRRMRYKSKFQTSDRLISADWMGDFDRLHWKDLFPVDESVEVIFHPEREEEYAYLMKDCRK